MRVLRLRCRSRGALARCSGCWWHGPHRLPFGFPSLRDSFVYHYMPSYAFALILLAGFADRFYQRHRLPALISLLVVAEVLLFYAPLWGELAIAANALNARLLGLWA
jgi:dolichyl-phosphate-mannose--protein O-mannosyl transferase